jgi:hypothetical protein
MALSPRAIALDGVGFSARLLAVRGLWPEVVQPPVYVPQVPGGGVAPRRRPRVTLVPEREPRVYEVVATEAFTIDAWAETGFEPALRLREVVVPRAAEPLEAEATAAQSFMILPSAATLRVPRVGSAERDEQDLLELLSLSKD